MLNMETVGFKISELRKSRNMTQMELADKMNISFQAVSNWERGHSMPDISKLPELAQLFGVTIDEILGERSELVESAVKEELDDYLKCNTVTPQQLGDVAAILKPEQVDAVFEKTPINGLEEIADLLPFISRDVINQLAQKAAEAGNYEDLDEIAPFVDRTVMGEIARKMIDRGESIGDIAPFISREMISELAETFYQKEGLSSIEDIAPFIPAVQLQKIAEEEYASRGLCHFESIAPFLNRNYLSELAHKAIEKEGIKAISPIAPFLDRDMLSAYVKEQYIK